MNPIDEKLIKLLVDLGHSVLFIPELNKVFLVNHWEPAIDIGGTDKGCHLIKGIEMSSILPTLTSAENKNSLTHKLEAFSAEQPVLVMKFSSIYKWIEYVPR